jgi:hypothetical protein
VKAPLQEKLCRTQALVTADPAALGQLLERPLGNHLVMIPGAPGQAAAGVARADPRLASGSRPRPLTGTAPATHPAAGSHCCGRRTPCSSFTGGHSSWFGACTHWAPSSRHSTATQAKGGAPQAGARRHSPNSPALPQVGRPVAEAGAVAARVGVAGAAQHHGGVALLVLGEVGEHAAAGHRPAGGVARLDEQLALARARGGHRRRQREALAAGGDLGERRGPEAHRHPVHARRRGSGGGASSRRR